MFEALVEGLRRCNEELGKWHGADVLARKERVLRGVRARMRAVFDDVKRVASSRGVDEAAEPPQPAAGAWLSRRRAARTQEGGAVAVPATDEQLDGLAVHFALEVRGLLAQNASLQLLRELLQLRRLWHSFSRALRVPRGGRRSERASSPAAAVVVRSRGAHLHRAPSPAPTEIDSPSEPAARLSRSRSRRSRRSPRT
jgi:hypothetical protein